jgi:hypothetical protein
MRTAFSLVMILTLCLSAIRPAVAQTAIVRYNRVTDTISVDARRVDVRRVIEDIFNSIGRYSYQVDTDVRGYISIQFENQRLERALAMILEQVGASFRMDGRNFVIFSNTDRTTPLQFRTPVDISARERPIAEVVRVLGQQARVTIRLDRDIPSEYRVTIVSKREPLWNVLQRLANAADLRVEVTGWNTITLYPRTRIRVDYRGRRIGDSDDYGYCRFCRYSLKVEWRFCPMCGERIRRERDRF